MSQRIRLPNRRPSMTFEIAVLNLRFTATVSRFSTGEVAELFLENHKCDSGAGTMASDAAIAASLALQFGCPVEVLSKALSRDAHGKASGPLGAAFDRIIEEGDR